MILGINTSHDSCFCLIDDEGKPLYILEEERFNRVKHTGFGTLLAIDALIKEGLLNTANVTDLVYSFEMEPDLTSKLMNRCYENVVNDFGVEAFQEAEKYFHQPEQSFSPTQGLGLSVDFELARAKLRRLFPNAQDVSYMHHLCHAASAFYPSPFNSAAVIVLDGSGRLETTTIWHASEKGIALLREIELPHSIGILYWLFSQYLRLEEGQTMGLAAYGEPRYKRLIYKKILSVDEEGNFRFKAPIVCWFDMDSEYALGVIEQAIGVRSRKSRQEPLTQFHADIAASIQQVTEEMLLKLAAQTRRLTGEKNLCLAGGVIQNCVANGRLVSERIFSETWIQPMANDAGTALGAALYHYYKTSPSNTPYRWRMTTAQAGLDYASERIEACLQRLKIPYKKIASPAKEAARAIAEGKTVGWFQSRAEVGPRALGGRSILADARNRFNPFTVNEIKQRQPWRPFAPSILEERESDYVESAPPSPFMILSFPIRDDARPTVPAICHIDGSARVQTVSRAQGGPYYDLLLSFYESTGIPVVLNTSFNLRSEPIVQHPLEAIRDFLISGIDHLFLNDFSIEFKPLLDAPIKEALSASGFVSLYENCLRDFEQVLFIRYEGLTARQQQRKAHLQTILGWLDISYDEIDASGLQAAIGAAPEKISVISIAPLEDRRSILQLPRPVLGKLSVSILDGKMFMALASAEEFLQAIDTNCKQLSSLIARRRVIVLARGPDLDDIKHVLKHLEIRISDVDPNAAEIRADLLKGKQNSVFLIVSFAVMDEFKSDLRLAGYHSGNGYLVWETD